MRLVTIDRETEGTFFRCLHDERPQDPRVTEMRRHWHADHLGRGLRAKVMFSDADEIVGMCQYIPIEHSHLVGEGLLAILCMWIHGYEHLVGNQQGRGYGTHMLAGIERDARESGFAGVAAWGMNHQYWYPASFFLRMGYERVEEDPPVVLVWKPFRGDAQPPRLHRPKPVPAGQQTEGVTIFNNGWCTGACGECIAAKDAVAGLDPPVDLTEIDTSDQATMARWGIDDAVYLDGQQFRRWEEPWAPRALRDEIVARRRRS